MVDNSYTVVRHPVYNDEYRYPVGGPVDAFSSAVKYEATERDVFICTYAKCGTTWAQTIVYMILHNGNGIPKDRKLRSFYPFLEFDGGDFTKSTDDGNNVHLIKTHFPYHWVPKHPKAKYLYIARNPKDVITSLYYHVIGFKKYYNYEGTVDDFVKGFLEAKVDCGDYFKFVTGYFDNKDNENLLCLLYEDMKFDLRKEILKIAKFLGEEHYEKLLANNESLLKKIVAGSSFDAMSNDQEHWTSVSRPKDLPFIRKGVIGDWKNLLSKQQANAIDKKLKENKEISDLWKNYAEYL